MDFTVIGEITDIETFAVGRGFENGDAFSVDLVRDDGESGRGEPVSGSRTARFETPKFTGTRRPALVARN